VTVIQTRFDDGGSCQGAGRTTESASFVRSDSFPVPIPVRPSPRSGGITSPGYHTFVCIGHEGVAWSVVDPMGWANGPFHEALGVAMFIPEESGGS
jgi:hypothetical protein